MTTDTDTTSPIELLLRPAPVVRGGLPAVEVHHVWGDALLASRTFRPSQAVSIGVGGTFPAPDVDGLAVLVEPTPEGPVARIRDGWTGFAVDGRRVPFASLPGCRHDGDAILVPLTLGRTLVIEVGSMSFVVRCAPRGSAAGVRLAADWPFLALSTVAGMSAMILAAVMTFAPGEPQSQALDLDPQVFDVEMFQAKPPPPKVAASGESAREQEKPAAGNRSKKRGGGESRVQDTSAKTAGVFGLMADDGILASLGDGGVRDAIGKTAGMTRGGTSIGNGKLGDRGGFGEGGEADLGGDGPATHGLGSGDRGYGTDGADLGVKHDGGLSIPQEAIVLGPIDRAAIDEVVKRHMNQIRYCYQRELTKDQTLGGKEVIKFSIAKDGTVSSADVKSSTVGSSVVDQCVAREFQRMTFPAPRGGGLVIVSYPFLFSPS
jgi:hypothetical protein